jgi:hypothetical protein
MDRGPWRRVARAVVLVVVGVGGLGLALLLGAMTMLLFALHPSAAESRAAGMAAAAAPCALAGAVRIATGAARPGARWSLCAAAGAFTLAALLCAGAWRAYPRADGLTGVAVVAAALALLTPWWDSSA